MNVAAPGGCDLQVVTKDIELFGAIEDGLIVVRGHRAELNQRSLGDRYATDLRISRGKPDRPPPRVLEAHALLERFGEQAAVGAHGLPLRAMREKTQHHIADDSAGRVRAAEKPRAEQAENFFLAKCIVLAVWGEIGRASCR